MYFIKGKGF